jgi:hypothetical protein
MVEQIPDYDENSRLVRAFSFGGGVQSHAVLALQAMGQLLEPYDVFLFSNVGHDSENPDTLAYLNEYTIPFCEEFGIPFVELRRNIRGRGETTLVEEIFYQQRSIIIPAYFGQGGFGNRNCTTDFKVRVIDRYIRDAGYTHGIVGLGISTDEFTRARSTNWHHYEGQDYEADPDLPQQTTFEGMEAEPEAEKSRRNIGFWKQREYPLLNMRVDRAACTGIIQQAGLPVPPKSSCFFCPFTRPQEWITLKEQHPALFEKAVEIEDAINEKRLHLAKDGMFLHRTKRPLREAVFEPEPPMFEDDGCDSGHCFV